MKNLILLILVTLFTFRTLGAQSDLVNIQSRIEAALGKSFGTSSSDALDSLITDLEGEDQSLADLRIYWLAYAHFYKVIFDLYGPNKSVENAKLGCANAIGLLEALENPNSEDFALMAYIKGFTLQWVTGQEIASESQKAGQWAGMAVELNSQNPRAFYVLGNQDFHTPQAFGGGKKARGLLETALELFKQSPPNPILPSWGMSDTYAALVKVYKRDGELDRMKATLEEGLAKFPSDHELNRLNKVNDK